MYLTMFVLQKVLLNIYLLLSKTQFLMPLLIAVTEISLDMIVYGMLHRILQQAISNMVT